ncbi:hypothetical protein NG42_08485 [Winslowiella iniecta]|uniref:Uncharacterized protein n=1 Tax=Winslowiella iniecta TaxID=1560201 RepID=A0A0L7T5G2_9GAMM|nr:hypothetical protein NG43_19375 [Winslowiella iniecta]KOC90421.1 hypothetical protein NG42_08485 [Winslowiella iniecta]
MMSQLFGGKKWQNIVEALVISLKTVKEHQKLAVKEVKAAEVILRMIRSGLPKQAKKGAAAAVKSSNSLTVE